MGGDEGTPLQAPGIAEGDLGGGLERVVVTRGRFVQLAVFGSACFLSAQNVTIFSPIWSDAEQVRGSCAARSFSATRRVGFLSRPLTLRLQRFNEDERKVNRLANLWNIWGALAAQRARVSERPLSHVVTSGVPGCLGALLMVQHTGLRTSALAGYCAQLTSVVLSSYAATSSLPPSLALAPHSAYRLLFWAQIMGASSQPFFVNSVTLLTEAWFPPAERDAAVAFSLICVASGLVFIGVFAPDVVHAPDELGRVFWWQGPCWSAVLLAGYLTTADEPAAPPSAAAAVQRLRARHRARDPVAMASHHSWGAEAARAKADILTLISNPNFNALNTSTAVLQGVITCLATVIGQLMRPCGLSDYDVGLAMSWLSGTSVLIVLVYVFLARRAEQQGKKRYVEHQWFWSLSTVFGIALVLGSLYRGVGGGFTVLVWSILGLLSGVIVNGALIFEHAADMTFPTPANVSMTVLGVTSSFVAYCFVMAATPFLEQKGVLNCQPGLSTTFGVAIMGLLGVGCALLLPLRPNYRRSDVEARVLAGSSHAADSHTYGSTVQMLPI